METGNARARKAVLGELKRPVRLIVFKNDAGCSPCPEAVSLAREIKDLSPKIGLEIYHHVMDRDKTDLYGVTAVPTTVVQGMDGRAVRFAGVVEGVFENVLLECIRGASVGREWFPENIRATLKLLEHPVPIRVFVETDCPQCRPMAETAIGLGFESDFIATEIISAGDFPDLIKKHDVRTLPLILFGENIRREGHVSESDFLELIFQAEGLKPVQARHCIVCGTTSPDIICQACKVRIQAEAVDHKLRGEKLKRSDNVA